MFDDSILVKGNKDGLNVVINMERFKNFDEMLEKLVARLSKGKKFYKGSTIKITSQLKYISENETQVLKKVLCDEFLIKNCTFDDTAQKAAKVFSGIYEGKTKFIRRTIRSGQVINYPGNLVIIGDVNSGSEVYAEGNIIVVGTLRGHVHAGSGGNSKAIVAAFILQPEILQIAGIVTRSPEDNIKPRYPEVAKIKDDMIIVEPYLPNKYI